MIDRKHKTNKSERMIFKIVSLVSFISLIFMITGLIIHKETGPTDNVEFGLVMGAILSFMFVVMPLAMPIHEDNPPRKCRPTIQQTTEEKRIAKEKWDNELVHSVFDVALFPLEENLPPLTRKQHRELYGDDDFIF